MVDREPTTLVRAWDDPAGMLTVDQARERILAAFAPLPATNLAIVESLGLVLAEEIMAQTPIPPFPNSAMDGFAVRAADTAGASPKAPVRLRVIGEARAGYGATMRVEPGTAVRIMTGAPVPDGADAVVRFEETDELGRAEGRIAGSVAVYQDAKLAANMRPEGEDVAAGSRVLAAGAHLRPAEIGMLAALGRTHVAVHRRPRIAVLATGDEVVDPGAPLGPGQIRNSNSSTVAAMVRRVGGEPVLLGVARDTTDELRAKLAEARRADLIVTTGGVSAGDYDFVKDVLQTDGSVEFWQVRIKPGKPLAFGRIGGVSLLGLPGNPVAAAIAFEQFARPVIRKLLGHTDLGIPTVRATILDRVENRGGRRHFVRVRVEPAEPGGYTARVVGSQGAGVLTSLILGNGLLVVPEDVAVADKLTAEVHYAEAGMHPREGEHRDLQDAEVGGVQQQHAKGEEAKRVGDEVAALVDVSGDRDERNFNDLAVARHEDGCLPLEEAWQYERTGEDVDDEERDQGGNPLIGKNRTQPVQRRLSPQCGYDEQAGERREEQQRRAAHRC